MPRKPTEVRRGGTPIKSNIKTQYTTSLPSSKLRKFVEEYDRAQGRDQQLAILDRIQREEVRSGLGDKARSDFFDRQKRVRAKHAEAHAAQKKKRQGIKKAIEAGKAPSHSLMPFSTDEARQAAVTGDLISGPGQKKKGGAGNLLLKALEIVDTPRAAVASGLKELGQTKFAKEHKTAVDAATFGPLGIFGKASIVSEGKASLKDYGQQTRDPEKRVYGSEFVKVKNPIVRTAAGLAIDVGADPLTYVGGIGLAKKGAQVAAEHVAEQGAKQVAEEAVKRGFVEGGRETLDDFVRKTPELLDKQRAVESAVQRTRRLNVSGLSKQEAEQYGLRHGLGIRVPGSKIEAPLTLGNPSRTSRALHELYAKVGDTVLGTVDKPRLQKFLGASSETALKARSGTPREAFEAVVGGTKAKKIVSLTKQTEVKLAREFNDILKDVPQDAHETLVNALRGNEQALEKLKDTAPKARQFLDDIHQSLVDQGVQVRRTEDYFPNVLTPEARRVLGIEGAGDGTDAIKAWFEKGRTLGYDEGKFTGKAKFLGENIKGDTPDALVNEAERVMRERIAANPTLRNELTDANVALFSRDASDVMARYIQRVARRLSTNKVIEELTQMGIGRQGREALTRIIPGQEGKVAQIQQALAQLQGEQVTTAELRDEAAMLGDQGAGALGLRAATALEGPDVAAAARTSPLLTKLAGAEAEVIRAKQTFAASASLDATKAGYRATAVDNLITEASTLRQEAEELRAAASQRAEARVAQYATEAKVASREAKALQAQVEEIDRELAMVAEMSDNTADALEHEAQLQQVYVQQQQAVAAETMASFEGTVQPAVAHYETVNAQYAQAKRVAQFGEELDANIEQIEELARGRTTTRGASFAARAIEQTPGLAFDSRSAAMASRAYGLADQTMNVKLQNVVRYALELDSPEQWRSFVDGLGVSQSEKLFKGLVENRASRERMYALAKARAGATDLPAQIASVEALARSARAKVVAQLRRSSLSWAEVQEPRILRSELEVQQRSLQTELRSAENRLNEIARATLDPKAPQSSAARAFDRVSQRAKGIEEQLAQVEQKIADVESVGPMVEQFQKAQAQRDALKGPRLNEIKRVKDRAEKAMYEAQGNYLKFAREARAKGRTVEQQLDHAHRAVVDAQGAKAELDNALAAQAERVGKVAELKQTAKAKSAASKAVEATTGAKFAANQARQEAVARDLSKYGARGAEDALPQAREEIISRISTAKPSPATRRAAEGVMAAVDAADMTRVRLGDSAAAAAERAATSQQKAAVIRDIVEAGDLGNPELLAAAEDLATSYEEAARWGLLGAEQGQGVRSEIAQVAQYREAAELARARMVNMEQLNTLGQSKLSALTETIDVKTEALRSGMFKEIRHGTATPNTAADAILAMETALKPAEFGKFLRTFHNAVGWLKSWQIATPGFSARNFLGGMWQNSLADMDPKSAFEFIGVWGKVAKAGRDSAKLAKLNPEDVAMFRQVEGIVGRGLVGTEFSHASIVDEILGHTKRTLLPSRRNAYVQAMRSLNEKAEFGTRGMLAWDLLKRGHSPDEALNTVLKYHFDYSDLSRVEQGIKEVIPFYTWTRYNVPLQMEMLARHPRTFARYQQVKGEIEQLSEQDPYVADWMVGENLGIRLPFMAGGGHQYAMIDLPLRDLSRLNDASPGQIAEDTISQVTPILKAPIEYQSGKQFFKGLPLRDDRFTTLDPRLAKVPGLGDALAATGHAEVVDGEVLITEKDAYIMDQFIPVLARLRRLAPHEEKFQKRISTSWLSFIGVGTRSNTLDEQEIAKFVEGLDSDKALTRQKAIERALKEAGK